MRFLGRPNRDQIVTSRPSELTTLEAINLANGRTLADLLAKGAARYQLTGSGSRESIIDDVFRLALTRLPTESERAALAEIVQGTETNAPITTDAIEDLLWAICMTPKFMLIR